MRLRSIVSFALLLGVSVTAHAQATLTLAEQPVRLIRGAAVYQGINGSAVQRDDIVETGAAGVQIEAGKNTIVALGPQTRLFIVSVASDDKSATELAVLSGWIKVSSHGSRRTLITTPALQVTLASGATIVQAKQGRDALFADEGVQQAALVDARAKPGTPVKLALEQFAYVDPSKPQLQLGRASREFIAEMPRTFRDRLAKAPPVPNAGKVAPLKERDVSFADVSPWMLSTLPVRRNFVSRFKGRLADAQFKTALDHALGQSPEWRFILRPSVSTGSHIY